MDIQAQELLLRTKNISKLTPRQRAILKLRFGLGVVTHEESEKMLSEHKHQASIVRKRTLKEVGEIFGRSRERIRQIEKRLLEKLQIRI